MDPRLDRDILKSTRHESRVQVNSGREGTSGVGLEKG